MRQDRPNLEVYRNNPILLYIVSLVRNYFTQLSI